MKETLETLTSNFFSYESEYIDRSLKGINESKDKQDALIKNALDNFSNIDLKINKAVDILHTEVNTLKDQTSLAVVQPPSFASIAATNTQPSTNSETRTFNILIYPSDTSNSIHLGSLKKEIQASTKNLNINLQCINLYNISKRVKMTVPTPEDQQLVAKIFDDPSLKEKYKLHIPRETTFKLMLKFTTINCPNELAEELVSKNPAFPPESFKVLFSIEAKNDYHWKIKLQKPFNPLINTKFVFVGLKKFFSEPFISVNHCKHCGAYGHKKKMSRTITPMFNLWRQIT
ncbi:hypothetical protein JTE90_006766 [Oedothorax gibbosus]|uniref:Uncharacterized protein n=1 Tax=Oedothorax gibbosus TaxID=931172 RepID=A0AAV6UKZ8_9ARAC|nr:hypothetical protein JTE90_006766 [Oedothorax gibbosus]